MADSECWLVDAGCPDCGSICRMMCLIPPPVLRIRHSNCLAYAHIHTSMADTPLSDGAVVQFSGAQLISAAIVHDKQMALQTFSHVAQPAVVPPLTPSHLPLRVSSLAQLHPGITYHAYTSLCNGRRSPWMKLAPTVSLISCPVEDFPPDFLCCCDAIILAILIIPPATLQLISTSGRSQSNLIMLLIPQTSQFQSSCRPKPKTSPRAPRSMLSISEIEIYKTARSRQGEPAKCHAKRDFLQSMASIGFYETGTGMPVNYLRGECVLGPELGIGPTKEGWQKDCTFFAVMELELGLSDIRHRMQAVCDANWIRLNWINVSGGITSRVLLGLTMATHTTTQPGQPNHLVMLTYFGLPSQLFLDVSCHMDLAPGGFAPAQLDFPRTHSFQDTNCCRFS
uniref:HDC10904 n=1 Tax=Drosophila melanogaster TaxID=7227 RepID=Q6IL07_DROME|nr:TPA_inf: HDC10904 [Drosophila melanogaster]